LPSRNGRSSKVVAHSASPSHPAAQRRPWRVAAVAVIGLAQAAAILIALGLAGRTPEIAPVRQGTQIVHNDVSPGDPGPSVVRVSLPVRVEVNVDEGRLVMIRAEGQAPEVVVLTRQMTLTLNGGTKANRAEGQAPQVVVVTGQGIASALDGWCVVGGGLGGTAIVAQEMVPGVDPWYVMFNELESIAAATPRIAAR
jgi:hypothetical protein